MKPRIESNLVHEFLENGKSAACPIIDMHCHLGGLVSGHLPTADTNAMIHSCRRVGVTKIVSCPSEALLGDINLGNEDIDRAIMEYPDFFYGYWGVNPNFPELTRAAPEQIEKRKGFAGFKLLPDYHTYPLTGPAYAPVLEYAHEHRLLILIHTWGGSAYNSPQQVGQVAKRYPDAILLMGHSGHGDWQGAVHAAQTFKNVYLELTAVYVAHDFGMLPAGSGTPLQLLSTLQLNGIIEHMVEKTGSEKIVYGTDMPWYSPHFAAGSVLFARITDEDRHNILHANADRLLIALDSEDRSS